MQRCCSCASADVNAAVATAPIAATAAAPTATVAAADDMSASAAAVVVGRLLGAAATVVEAVATADLLPPPRTCLHLPRFTEQCHREGSQHERRSGCRCSAHQSVSALELQQSRQCMCRHERLLLVAVLRPPWNCSEYYDIGVGTDVSCPALSAATAKLTS